MTAYIIVSLEITDMKKYESEALPAVRKAHDAYNAERVVIVDNPETLIGNLKYGERIVVFQFPDVAQARAFHYSPEMQQVIKIARSFTSDIRALLVPVLEQRMVDTGI